MLEMLSKGGQLTYDLKNTIALCHVEDYCTEPGTTADTDQFTAAQVTTAGLTAAAAVAPAVVTSTTFAPVSTSAAAAAASVVAASTNVPVTPITLQSAMHSSNYSAATDVLVSFMSPKRVARCHAI
jgi:hypothetical protein